MTMTDKHSADHKAAGSGRTKAQERELDEALEDTFPASDPVSVGHATGDEEIYAPIGRRTPLLDVDLIKRLASKLKRSAEK